ncbi:hypothetical protein ACQQ2N_12270 [Dokdonella sp. MW10]|uniref:hypothetical protein n=1 Tax=Dokdonella sp. MW10 TaxID=2992926 RepID=UPI003F7CFAE3
MSILVTTATKRLHFHVRQRLAGQSKERVQRAIEVAEAVFDEGARSVREALAAALDEARKVDGVRP